MVRVRWDEDWTTLDATAALPALQFLLSVKYGWGRDSKLLAARLALGSTDILRLTQSLVRHRNKVSSSRLESM